MCYHEIFYYRQEKFACLIGKMCPNFSNNHSQNFKLYGEKQMVTVLITVKISKGWDTWLEMAKSLEPQMNEVGAKMIWAGCNADETAIYVLAEMQNPEQIKTFGERDDIVTLREAAGADVSSTTPIAQIGKYFLA